MISVVIPTKDRLVDLLLCLQGLANQDSLILLSEVIVIDDGSKQPYGESVLELAQIKQLPITYLLKSRSMGAAQARNEAAKQATGAIIAFLDDDSIPANNWLRVISDQFELRGGSAITGRILPYDAALLWSQARQLRYERRQRRALTHNGPVQFLSGGNCAIMKSDFDQMGGFDEQFFSMHDQELAFRLKRMKKSCFYAHDLLIYHRHYKGFFSLLNQSFRSAYYRNCLEQKYEPTEPWSFRAQLESFQGLLNLSHEEFHYSLPGLAAFSTELLHSFGRVWYKCISELRPSDAEAKF